MATKTAPETKLSRKPSTPSESTNGAGQSPQREVVFDIFRRWGFLQASLDPLGQYLPAEPFPTPAPDGPESAEARGYYCGSIGAEFMHIASPEKRAWIQQQLERPYTAADPQRILNGLIRADIFEQVIQQRYLGTKRFSLEGLTVLIPFLDQLFTTAAEAGVTRSVFAMSHRGRLNVMVNTVGRGSLRDLLEVRGREPAHHPRRRRREVPHGRDRRVQDRHRQGRRAAPRLQPQPSRSRRPRRYGPCPRPPGARRSRWREDHPPDDHPRRRRLRRPGHLGGDADPRDHQRLQRRRNHPGGRQQPPRLHREPRGVQLLPLRHRSREAATHSRSSTSTPRTRTP